MTTEPVTTEPVTTEPVTTEPVTAQPPTAGPVLTVVRGRPTDEELAVLVAVLVARSSGGEQDERRAPSLWSLPAHRVRRPVSPGPVAWRLSGLPS